MEKKTVFEYVSEIQKAIVPLGLEVTSFKDDDYGHLTLTVASSAYELYYGVLPEQEVESEEENGGD
jgi:hypothetical protein